MLRVFDFNIQTIAKGKTKTKGKKKAIRLVSMRDDEFILDKCDFDEIEKPEDKNAPKSP